MKNKGHHHCAVTGSAHTPLCRCAADHSQEIAEQAIVAAEAVLPSFNLHPACPRMDGRPASGVYARFLPYSQATDAVVNITTGGSATMSVKDRLAAAAKFKPDVLTQHGSINFAFPAPRGSNNGNMTGGGLVHQL